MNKKIIKYASLITIFLIIIFFSGCIEDVHIYELIPQNENGTIVSVDCRSSYIYGHSPVNEGSGKILYDTNYHEDWSEYTNQVSQEWGHQPPYEPRYLFGANVRNLDPGVTYHFKAVIYYNVNGSAYPVSSTRDVTYTPGNSNNTLIIPIGSMKTK